MKNRSWRTLTLLPTAFLPTVPLPRALLLLAIGLVCTASPGVASTAAVLQDEASYRLIDDWPHYPSDMVFEMGTGIAADAEGTIYTISRDVDHWAAHPLAMTRYRGSGTIARWDRQGRFLGTFATGKGIRSSS